MLFDVVADPEGFPGLDVVLHESMNDMPTLDEAKAYAWSLENHLHVTGAAFFDLTARRGPSMPSRTRTRRPITAARRSRTSCWAAVRLGLGLGFRISFKTCKIF